MTFKPRQQNPTSDGADVFGQVIHAPLQMRMRVEATPGFFEIMRQGDVSPAQVGSAITDYFSSNISRFVDNNRQQKAMGGQDQQWRGWSAPGINVRYRNNHGQETLEYDVFPERAPVETYASVFQIDLLYDGYVYLTATSTKPDPVSIPGYWIRIGMVQYRVDFVAIGPPAHDSGTAWDPFNPTIELFDPDAWVVGLPDGDINTRIVTFTDVTTINHSTPFKWMNSDLVKFDGGYGFDPVPVPDSVESVTFTVNGQTLATASVPVRDTPQVVTVLIVFGPDGFDEHSYNDTLQPGGTKLLNKIIPERQDGNKPTYFPLFPDTSGHTVTSSKIQLPTSRLNITGANIFRASTTKSWGFVAEFYDRKTFRKVIQSPHFSASSDGSLITVVNDKNQVWANGGFSSIHPTLIDFQDPNAVFSSGGGGPS